MCPNLKCITEVLLHLTVCICSVLPWPCYFDQIFDFDFRTTIVLQFKSCIHYKYISTVEFGKQWKNCTLFSTTCSIQGSALHCRLDIWLKHCPMEYSNSSQLGLHLNKKSTAELKCIWKDYTAKNWIFYIENIGSVEIRILLYNQF